MKKTVVLLGMALTLCAGVQAQTSQPALPPGKIAVFKAGTPDGKWNISKAKVQPCYVEVFDTVTNNQLAPWVTVPLSTNASVPGSCWINAHAGSEGGGIARTTDRQFLALEGYTGNILATNAAKPSAATGVNRGIVTLDAFTNAISIYSDPAAWFGLPPGVTQNNPTGIASTDGTNFWGTGNVTGTSTEAAGTLFYNRNVGAAPYEIQNYIQAAAQARIVGGTLYVVVPGAGVYNFLNAGNNQVVPLPYDPNVANPYQTVALTNMFLQWSSPYANIANFDMNPQGTIAYGADQTYGIVKYTNNAGIWYQAPYIFGSTNIGTTASPLSEQGCFGICVDFSSTNPVIYATTMENGTTIPGNNQGNANQNRLIKIVDNGNPGTNLVAVTLATAPTTNEVFRGIDFTPDLSPLITAEPVNTSTTNGGTAAFTVGVQSVYALNYQWLQNGTNLVNATNATLTLGNLPTTFNGYAYQCIVSNNYGVVTSAPPAGLTVTFVTIPPVITNAVAHVTNFIGNSVTFTAITPTGTQPFTYQWYQGNTALSDDVMSSDGATFSGSTNDTLTISGIDVGESGNYYLTAHNAAGTASNLVDVLTVQYQPPVIGIGGQPHSLTTFVGLAANLTVTPSGGTQPLSYQWYLNGAPLTDGGDFSGSQSGTTASTLTISPASLGDGGSYTVAVSNPGGSVTSLVATVTVLIPPAHSAVGYSNQVYIQNFDSLPDPGASSVNSINNPQFAGSIDGLAYSLANPFDFAYPVITTSYVGGLGLSNSLSGWYGAADTQFLGVSGFVRFAAQDGDQTTGGVIDFGPNDANGVVGTNRALGLLSTSTTGSTTYALKLVNQSSNALNYVDIGYLGELWHNGTTARTMTFGYTLDNTANSFVLSAESISNATLVPGLTFSFPTAIVVTTTDGTQPANQVALSTNNLALSSPWQPGAALWLIWSIDYYGSGSGNGYAIDNLRFSASANASVPVSQPTLGGISYNGTSGLGFSFTNAPGASSQFTVYSTTNLVPPVTWTSLGHPTETPGGTYSTYNFVDPSAKTNVQKFYQVRP